MMQFLFEMWKQYAYSSTAFTTVLILTVLGLLAFFILLIALHNVYRELQRVVKESDREREQAKVKLDSLTSKLTHKTQEYTMAAQASSAAESTCKALTESNNALVEDNKRLSEDKLNLTQANAILEGSKKHLDRTNAELLESNNRLVEANKGLEDSTQRLIDQVAKHKNTIDSLRCVQADIMSVLSFVSYLVTAHLSSLKTLTIQNIFLAVDDSGAIVHVNITSEVERILLERANDRTRLSGNIITDLGYENLRGVIRGCRTKLGIGDGKPFIIASVMTAHTFGVKYVFLHDKIFESRFGDSLNIGEVINYLITNIGRKTGNFAYVPPHLAEYYGFQSCADYMSRDLLDQSLHGQLLEQVVTS